MTQKDPYRLFVAHSFAENAEYNQVFEYLESRDNFFYINFSNPESQKRSAGLEALQEEIRAQIRNVEVVIVPAGVLAGDTSLIEFEIKVAQAFNKPIVLIQSFGGTISMPKAVLDAATEAVEWNDRSIIDAIRRAARGEDTAKWDVIEFDMDDFKPEGQD